MSLFQKLNLILKLCSKIEKQFQDNGQYIMNSHCTLFYKISGESIILSCGIMCKPNHISKLLVFANWICNEENLWIFKFILGCLSLIAVQCCFHPRIQEEYLGSRQYSWIFQTEAISTVTEKALCNLQ